MIIGKEEVDQLDPMVYCDCVIFRTIVWDRVYFKYAFKNNLVSDLRVHIGYVTWRYLFAVEFITRVLGKPWRIWNGRLCDRARWFSRSSFKWHDH